MKKGFTLIELLVVVLIIGILSAVALPQYQVAVMKTRLLSQTPLLKAIKESQERYYLENGEYSFKLANLDIGIPGECEIVSKEENSCFCNAAWRIDNHSQQEAALGSLSATYCPTSDGTYNNCLQKAKLKITFYYRHSSYPDKIECHPLTAYDSSGIAAKVCKSMRGMF